jgi:hypothetical protein
MTTTKSVLKGLAKRLLPPSVFQKIMAVRSRRWQFNRLASNGSLDEVRRYIEKHGTVVQSGPFAGLVYPLDAAITRWSTPKLLGTYEMELHPLLYAASSRKYECVIDIGSAEGYYSAGLARLLQVPVYAYDPEPYEKAFAILMAQTNGVSHLVEMANLFTVEEMSRFAGRRALVMSDCEGFEKVLFRPDTVELTRNWDLIIELHGTADAVLPTLHWPHKLTMIDLAERHGLENERRRGPQRFLYCDSLGMERSG